MKMQVDPKSLNFLRNETKLEVPFFQRPYVWKYENVKLLLDDLIRTNGNHFLGSILLKLEYNEIGKDTSAKQVIIDGQQRLTTLSILIKVMFDYLRESKCLKPAERAEGQNALFYPIDKGYMPHVENSYHDKENFKKIIGEVITKEIPGYPYPVDDYTAPEYDSVKNELDNEKDLSEDAYEKRYNDSDNLLRECYKYLVKRICAMEASDVKKLWDKLFDDNIHLLVIIRLGSEDKEQEIFDTINSAGIHLSSTDIIKNHLYQQLLNNGVSQAEVLKKYQDTWEATFEEGKVYQFWNKEKSVGRNLRSNLELFFQAYGIIHEPKIYDVEEDTLSDLAKKYKEYLKTLTSERDVTEFIDDIIDTANIYYESLPRFSNSDPITFDEIGKRVACIMDVSDNTTFTPYLLYLYKKYGRDEQSNDILNSKLEHVDNILMHYIISGNSNKNFNKYCTDLIDDDKTGRNNSASLNNVTYEDLKNGIKIKKNNTLAKLILYCIELHRNSKGDGSDKKYISLQFTNEMELEHILPKKWEENWSSEKTPFVRDDGNLIQDQEEGKKNRNNRLFSLGNMTILPKKLNIKISNGDFFSKINGKSSGKKKFDGMRKLSSFSITKEFLPDESSPQDEYAWNEQKIAEREARLLEEIIKIWPIEE